MHLRSIPLLAFLQEADGSEHAPVLCEFFHRDQQELEAAEALKAAEGVLRQRISVILRSRGVSPGPLFGKLGREAIASGEDLSSDTALEDFITSRLP